MKWLYKDNFTVFCKTEEQIDALKDHFADKKTCKVNIEIVVAQAIKMVGDAKQSTQPVQVETPVEEPVKAEGPTEEEVLKWIRQKCDSFLRKNEQAVPEEKGVDVGRKAVIEFLNK